MRMMASFEKGDDIRFIGHLDLMRTMQRALRRSGLPLSFSNGFNPHIRLSFAMPLSVGVSGSHELMDVPLEEDVSCEEFKEKLNAVLPACMQVNDCRVLSEDGPSLMSLVAGADYEIRTPVSDAGKVLFTGFQEFISQKSCVAVRKTKSGENPCDIFQFVVDSKMCEKDQEYLICLRTLANQGGMLKPSVWFGAFCEYSGTQDVPFTACRTHILALDSSGRLAPMDQLL